MRGLCKTSCGCEIEFEPHEFSDGFVYYLPRNLDHTPHQCVIFNAVEECYQDPDPDMEEFYQENKTRLKITQEKFNELINDAFADPVSFLDSVFDTDNMDMLRKGKMFELKKYIENNLNVLSYPFFMSRSPDNGTGQNAPVEMSIFSSKVNVEELLNFIPLILPMYLQVSEFSPASSPSCLHPYCCISSVSGYSLILLTILLISPLSYSSIETVWCCLFLFSVGDTTILFTS